MNKVEILTFAEESHAKAVTALLNNQDINGNKFKNDTKRYAYVAGLQSALISQLVDYIKTH